MWNSSLYVVSLIYRLNQSKVYIWRILCTFAYVRVWICYDIAITESPASILVYLSLLVSNDNANDSVVGKSLGIVRGKIRFYKLIGFSAKPQNATNRNQRNNRKQGKCENVVFLNFCFCIVSRQDRILVSVLIFRWLWNNKIDLRSSYGVKTKAYSYALYHICMSAQPLPIEAFGMGIDVTKITLSSWKPFCLAGKVWFQYPI